MLLPTTNHIPLPSKLVMKMVKMQTGRLALLPVEIVDAIVWNLCSFCRCPSHDEVEVDTENDAVTTAESTMVDRSAASKALHALCRTSRFLSPIAMRHLYHCLSCDPLPGKLVRTLFARPDLRLFVKKLWGFRALQDKHAEYLERVFRQAERAGGHERSAVVGRLCALLPNLEQLTVHHSDFRGLECRPCSLPKLKKLRLGSKPCHRREPMEVDKLAGLFRAASNITDLYLDQPWSCRRVEGWRLDHVTTLELDHAYVTVFTLGNILRLCPNVEECKYTGKVYDRDHWDEATPCEVKDKVLDLVGKGELTRLRSVHMRLCVCGHDPSCRRHSTWLDQRMHGSMAELEARGIVVTVEMRWDQTTGYELLN